MLSLEAHPTPTLSSRSSSEALLYIHGFNVTFTRALERCTQICADMDYQGLVLTYSWPSQGQFSLRAYRQDNEAIAASESHLAEVLLQLQRQWNVQRVHILAHSMGSRLLAGALQHAGEQGFDRRVSNILLASPDIEVDGLRHEILPVLQASAEHVSIYFSRQDIAKWLPGRRWPQKRLHAEIVPLPQVDLIEVSNVGRDILGHADYAKSPPVVEDIRHVLNLDWDPARRGLVESQLGIWFFPDNED